VQARHMRVDRTCSVHQNPAQLRLLPSPGPSPAHPLRTPSKTNQEHQAHQEYPGAPGAPGAPGHQDTPGKRKYRLWGWEPRNLCFMATFMVFVRSALFFLLVIIGYHSIAEQLSPLAIDLLFLSVQREMPAEMRKEGPKNSACVVRTHSGEGGSSFDRNAAWT